MLVTDFTKKVLASRRFARRMYQDGFVEVGEDGDPLWKLHRGCWLDKKIVDVAAYDKRLFIKVQ